MRIDTPLCGIKQCRYCKDGNCWNETTAKGCEFHDEFTAIVTKVYEKYPNDKDIWVLLQECINMRQKIEKICKEFDL